VDLAEQRDERSNWSRGMSVLNAPSSALTSPRYELMSFVGEVLRD
jgi:hypothetical protein